MAGNPPMTDTGTQSSDGGSLDRTDADYWAISHYLADPDAGPPPGWVGPQLPVLNSMFGLAMVNCVALWEADVRFGGTGGRLDGWVDLLWRIHDRLVRLDGGQHL